MDRDDFEDQDVGRFFEREAESAHRRSIAAFHREVDRANAARSWGPLVGALLVIGSFVTFGFACYGCISLYRGF